MISEAELVRAAIAARENSYSPYSGFMVGAALLTAGGKLYSGCNIENAAFTPTVCAERSAFFKAVSEGEHSFSAIAVAGWPKERGDKAEAGGFAYPCGVCRQVMMEFCEPEKFLVIVAESEKSFKTHTLKELLPYGFGPESLPE